MLDTGSLKLRFTCVGLRKISGLKNRLVVGFDVELPPRFITGLTGSIYAIGEICPATIGCVCANADSTGGNARRELLALERFCPIAKLFPTPTPNATNKNKNRIPEKLP